MSLQSSARLSVGYLSVAPLVVAASLHSRPATAAPTGDAQTASSSAEPQPKQGANRLLPPKLLVFHEAEIAESDRPQSDTAVELELTISSDGHVSNVRVVGGTESALDAAAAEAARLFTFDPAQTQDDTGALKPVSVTVRYRYWIEGRPETKTGPEVYAPPEEAPEQAPSAATTNAPADEIFEGTAEVEAPRREPTRRVMDSVELVRIPGTRGDPLRAIEVLPGVGQSTGDAPIIRGAGPQSSITLLDGTAVPFLYHFGGLTSFVHPRLVESVELYPGNFSARYGRAMGGVVEVALREPKKEFGVVVDANMIDASVLVEGPITEHLRFAAAARRSNIDFVFDQLVPDDAFAVTAAPLYHDYQAMLFYAPSKNNEWRLAFFGSDDTLRLVFNNPPATDPSLHGSVAGKLAFKRLQLRNRARFGDVHQNIQVALGTQELRQSFGPDSQGYFDISEFDSRAEWRWPWGERLNLVAGADVQGQRMKGAYRGQAAMSQEGSTNSSADIVVVEATTIKLLRPAAYLEAQYTPIDGWQLIPGLRLDYYHQLDEFTLNPRFSQRLALTETTTLKNGVGLYSQPPIYHEAFAPIGNPDVDTMYAVQTSMGVEERIVPGLELDVEGFYKWLRNRVVGTEGGAPPHFTNDGSGRIYGAELGATYRSSYGLSGQLSYTYSRSLRTDRDDPERPFDYDQPHILNAAATYELGAGWQLGSRFRFVSGNPSTRVLDAALDGVAGTYSPRYGKVNADRNPAFHQLDLRAQKTFQWDPIQLSVYLDVQNVYNAGNPQGYDYSYDYKKREPSTSSFLFPSLGVRGQL